MEIAFVPLAQARRGNRAQVEEWLATYTRLFAELTTLGHRLAAVGGDYSAKSPSPDHLRNRLERHFAPSLDGFQAVEELRGAKLVLENELATAQVRLREAIEDTHRRFRKLREDIQQTASAKSALLEFVEQACLGALSAEQKHDLRNVVETQLRSFSLPEVRPDAPPGAETMEWLKAAEHQLHQARQLLQKVQADCQQQIEKIQAARAEEHRRKIVQKLTGAAKAESLQDFLARHQATASPTAPAEDKVHRKLDALMAEIALLESTSGWQAIQSRAEEIRRERETSRRLILYEALVLDCGQRVRRLREHERWAVQLDELIDKATVHASQPEVKVVCDELRQVRRSGSCTDLKPLAARLDQALAVGRRAAEREEKRRLLLKSLEAMGYQIVEGMETAMQTAGRIVVQRDGEAEYAVEVVVNDDLSLVQTAMVRFAESGEMTEQQRLRDKEKEESWCQDHTRMRQQLAQHGLGATLKMHLKPGEHPVRIVQHHQRRPATRPHAERTDLRQKRL